MMSVLRAILILLPILGWAQDQGKFADREPKYRLQPSDVVEVEYTYTPEYNQVVSVQPDGYVTLKVIGGVQAAGLTLDGLRAAIKAKGDTSFNDPEVTVLLKEYVKPHFVVAGEVVHPGTFDLRGNVSLVEAIAISGGFKESSKQSQVVLVRKVNAEIAEVKVVDVKALMDPKNVREDLKLRPDDLVIVPRNRLGKIEPYVRLTSSVLSGLYGVALLK